MLCKSSPEGSTPEPVAIPDKQAPIPTNGTTASVDFPCNAILATGHACNAPKTARQKFCKRCTTRIRVARLRAKQAPLRELKARIENEYLSGRRHAIVNCAPLTDGNSTTSGKSTDYLRAQEIEVACLAARVRLRRLAKQRRDKIQKAKKENYKTFTKVARELKKENKHLTKTLARAIRASDERIKNQRPDWTERGNQ